MTIVTADMSGNILFYLIISVMIKENAETCETKSVNSWKYNVSLAAHKNVNDTITVENEVSIAKKIINNFRQSKTSEELYEDHHHGSNLLHHYGDEVIIQSPSPRATSTATVPDRKWKSSPLSKSCYNIPVYMSVCPQGFTYLSYRGRNLCYTITERQRFPPSCPYLHFLPYHEIKDILKKYFNNKPIWIHAFRNTTKFTFPQFEWFENGFLYGRTVTDEIGHQNQFQDANCLIFRDGAIFRVSCSNEYYSLCVYSTERLQSSHLINTCKIKGYDECIVGDYDLEIFKCYCKSTNLTQPTKTDFCEKLAEPIQPFQTQLLINHLNLDTDMCWFGLSKESSTGIYKWLSTNEKVIYTRWAKPENCGNEEGALKFGTPPYHGWTLATDRTLKCAICEFNVQFEKPTLELEYIASTNEVHLRIQHFVSISKPDTLGLYCFSDSNSDDFKTALNISHHIPHHKNTWTTVRIEKVTNHPSYYWCEAFEYSSKNIIKSNTVLAYKSDNFGHEFPIVVTYYTKPNLDPFITNSHVIICEMISKQIEQKYNYLQVLRPMRAHLHEETYLMEMLIHLTTKKTNLPIKTIHKQILEILESVSANNQNLNLTSFLSSEVCLPDNTLTPNNEILEWPETKIGATAIPSNRLCLDETRDMLPVTRYCEGNFLYGGTWADPIGTCFGNTTHSETTEKLFDLVQSNAPANNITNDLVQMTQENVHTDPIDVHLVSVVLERLATEEQEDVDSDKFSTVISNVMQFDEETLKEAQHLLNSTDKILSALDYFMYKEDPLLLVLPKLIVQITDLRKSNISGLALYSDNSEVSDFRSYKIDQLYATTSFDTLLQQENLDTAVLISENALNDLSQQFTDTESIKLIILLFYNDFLFNEQENSNLIQHSKTKIISVSSPGFVGQLEDPIKMAFKMPNNYLNIKNCSHWIYGLDQFMVSTYGKWKSDTFSQEKVSLLETCEFSHMTHFGVLLQNDPKEAPYNEIALDILTIIGSALSLIGIIPIFITAIAFKSWRSRPGNIILINFCIAITFQIILLFSLNAVHQDGAACKAIGASLHYLVLSEFFWMFVVALLQHKRFVMVFKSQEDTIVKKCLVVGWGFPLIPVIVTISVSLDNYKMNAFGFCQVVGYYYYFGYMLPIILILCSNAFIFIKITYSVARQSTESCAARSRNYKLEILLALFLFFVLGMTWIFGIIGAFGGGVWATYVFSVTATLRGLVLFLFFIAGNKETRLMWKKRSTYYMEKRLRKHENTPYSNVTNVSSE